MEDISGSTFDHEYTAYVKERDDLETPHQCDVDMMAPDAGAPLEELETHAAEFHMLVEEMFEALPEETRLLEGTEIPSYEELYTQIKNELSDGTQNESNGECTGDVAS